MPDDDILVEEDRYDMVSSVVCSSAIACFVFCVVIESVSLAKRKIRYHTTLSTFTLDTLYNTIS